jgi:hypothetical protein
MYFLLVCLYIYYQTHTSIEGKQYLLPIKQVGVAVMLHTYIQEVLGSNPGQDTGHYDRLFMVILNPSRQMLGQYKYAITISFQTLSNSFFTNHPTISQYIS